MSKAEDKNIDSVIQEGDFQEEPRVCSYSWEEQSVVIEVTMNEHRASKIFIFDFQEVKRYKRTNLKKTITIEKDVLPSANDIIQERNVNNKNLIRMT